MTSTIQAVLVWADKTQEGKTLSSPSISLVIDGQDSGMTVDYFEFATTTRRIDRQFIFTCTCGVAGCAGWHEGIKVKVRRNTVEWRTIDPSELGKYTGPVKTFNSFNRHEYEHAQKRVLELCEEIAAFRESDAAKGFSWSYYDGFGPMSVQEFKESLKSYLAWVKEYPSDLLTYYGRCV